MADGLASTYLLRNSPSHGPGSLVVPEPKPQHLRTLSVVGYIARTVLVKFQFPCLSPRPRPKLMAIGDSLGQGCRSLSVTADYCAQSWPARIAQTKDFEFIAPDSPRPILLDLEFEVRTFNIATHRARYFRFPTES